MNKSKATTALKSLLVSGCALFVWGMTPVFLASTLTSCEKLEDILGDGDEDEDDENGDGSSSGNLNGVGTTDGAAPYFNLETTRIEVPAVRDGEGIQVKCQTNIVSMRYVLEKFKKFSEGELTEQEDYSFILENPEYSFYGEEYLQYYTNYSSEKQTDNLLIYATDKDSLLATIPIEQAAAPHISVAKADAGINEITLTLEGQNDARFYSTYISTDSIPLFEVIQDLKNGGSGLPFEYLFDLQSQPTCTFSGLTEATKYYIYLQGGTEPGPLHGLSLYTVTTAMRGKEDALIMKYALNNLNNRTVYLPFEGRVKDVIDWGDGVTEVLDKSYVYSADLSHAYAQGAESTVEVAFKGTVESLTTNSTTNGEILKSSLIGITQWGTPELKTLRLEDVTALTQLAADTKGALSAITDFTSCFEGCTGLTNLPEDLFAMATGAETFDRAFQGCTGLTSLPLNLFAQNVALALQPLTDQMAHNFEDNAHRAMNLFKGYFTRGDILKFRAAMITTSLNNTVTKKLDAKTITDIAFAASSYYLYKFFPSEKIGVNLLGLIMTLVCDYLRVNKKLRRAYIEEGQKFLDDFANHTGTALYIIRSEPVQYAVSSPMSILTED